MSTCALTTATHHSEDRVEVYHGALNPVIACGFHATYFTAEVIATTRRNA